MAASIWFERKDGGHNVCQIEAPGGAQPIGASSKPLKSKPGATVQPTKVHAPRLCRRLPNVSRHDRLRAFARGKVRPERHALDGVVLGGRDLESERRSGVVMPGLDRIDPVPVRALAARKQEVDRGRCRAPALHRAGVAERLAKMSALGMRLEIEQANHIGG